MPVRIDGTGSVSGLTNYTAENFTTTDLTVTEDITNPSFNALEVSPRNLIINGSMQVAQRGTSATGVTGPGYTTVDRFSSFIINLGTWDVEQSTDAPAGFAFSKKLTCTTADVTPAASDRLNISYVFEGNDLVPALTTGGGMRSLSFSFWVKSNKTGEACINVYQTYNSLSTVVLRYNITAADTWQKVDLTIPADPSAVIPIDNNGSIVIEYWLNSGSDFQGGVEQGSWSPMVNANRNAVNLGVGGATSDYFAITGVQLTATDTPVTFQHEDYATTLAKCQRYYDKKSLQRQVMVYTSNNNFYQATVHWHQVMRAQPSVSFSTNLIDTQPGGTDINPIANNIDDQMCRIYTPTTISNGWNSIILNSGIFYILADAEL
ncbi:putative tail fiber protein [Synechococcus phage S-H34]|uniref:Putative tail fiber protein n=1 Tax=Synechococcus phage S-H34 TaxID=2718942 RepID=A0A6G8R6C7_9CAUD|nr:tail fiber protein [Synechococcus phage S-H34]QIN96933.1 putative tail fiber protein [Synechococcus phage S-H34]